MDKIEPDSKPVNLYLDLIREIRLDFDLNLNFKNNLNLNLNILISEPILSVAIPLYKGASGPRPKHYSFRLCNGVTLRHILAQLFRLFALKFSFDNFQQKTNQLALN